MTGRTLGHYEVLEKLGEGGMGVVWKARDARLDRLVALKVLPAGKVADPARKQRFVQEAKAASALNHPNIVTIHDIASEEGVDYIVMEYVPGKTLDQLIPRSGLRLAETLKYSTQIADALSKAHAAGIVHRDLKPANLMVSDDGRVKVLDFGLAKLVERVDFSNDGATQTLRAQSEEGMIVGTVSYMSPEQAEGKRVDARSDIFSFGAVMYEMVTGSKAFLGESRMSTLASVLNKDPRPAGELAEGLPRELEALIHRCLRKDPDRRSQSMADLKVALLELKEDSESGRLRPPAGPAATPKRHAMRWWVASLATAAGLMALATLYFSQDRQVRTTSLVPVPLTSYPGEEASPSLSPDGNQVAFAWTGLGVTTGISTSSSLDKAIRCA